MGVASVMSVATSLENFFQPLTDCSCFTLLADFDGTLAPFSTDRMTVTPYPGVRESISVLISHGVRVAIVSGRAAREVSQLLEMPSVEVWGSHGAERLRLDGQYSAAALSEIQANTDLILEALAKEQITSEVEVKPFSIAVHWRGLSPSAASELRYAAIRAFRSVPTRSYGMFPFDGGLEFRSSLVTKAQAIEQVRREVPVGPIAYLGDDLTDEDAFRALGSSDLGVLVRPEYRPTAAQVWLKPPDQLLDFLADLSSAIGENL